MVMILYFAILQMIATVLDFCALSFSRRNIVGFVTHVTTRGGAVQPTKKTTKALLLIKTFCKLQNHCILFRGTEHIFFTYTQNLVLKVSALTYTIAHFDGKSFITRIIKVLKL